MIDPWNSIIATNVPFEWTLPRTSEENGELLAAPKERMVSLDIRKDSVASIVQEMRKVHTRHAYKTSGLDKEGLLIDNVAFARDKWVASAEWTNRLEDIARTNGDSRELVEMFAVSLFVKRARGMDKVFVVAQRDQTGVWTDVRPSSTAMRPHFGACDPVALDHNSGTCGFCGKAPVGQRCARCRKVFYCDGTCQKEDWGRHKPLCTKKKLPKSDNTMQSRTK